MLQNFSIRDIKPQGWVKDFLLTQMEGLTGHIEKAGAPFNCVEWGKPDYVGYNAGWWVYEQVAYWLDGYLKCAILLEDEAAIKRASGIIYAVLRNPDGEGYLGPRYLKPADKEGWNRWPHVVFFRACMTLYDYTGDGEILTAITRHYLEPKLDFSFNRDVLNVEIMLWLFDKTGKKELLELAEKSYEKYNRESEEKSGNYKGKENHNCLSFALSNEKPYVHGVSYNEFSKLGALMYLYTGKKIYLDASVKAYEKLDKYFMLPSGLHCSNEFLISNRYMQSHETCNVTDYTWALYYLVQATGKTSYLDKIEKCVYNAGIGSVLENFRGLQYFSCCNQLILDKQSNHNIFYGGEKWMSYRPNPGTACCAGNVNRFMPNFVGESYMKDENGGIYATLFTGASLSTELDGSRIEIEQETAYPFREDVVFRVKAEAPFVFYVRVPAYAESVKVNGKAVAAKSGFLKALVEAGESTLSVCFDSKLLAKKKNGGVYFEKGALVYALGMKGDRKIDEGERDAGEGFPAYNIYPDEKWNYAVLPESAAFFDKGCDLAFDLDRRLPYIELKGYEIDGYPLRTKKKLLVCTDLYEKLYKEKTGPFTFTPPFPQKFERMGETKTLRLYPYGACKVRLTVLPIGKK